MLHAARRHCARVAYLGENLPIIILGGQVSNGQPGMPRTGNYTRDDDHYNYRDGKTGGL